MAYEKTQEQLEAHVGRVLDADELFYMRFLTTARTRKEGNVLVGKAYVEMPCTKCDEEVAAEYKYSLTTEEYTQTLEDYLLAYTPRLNGILGMFTLAARDAKRFGASKARRERTTAYHLGQFDTALTAHNYDSSKWINTDEYIVAMASASYNPEA